MNKFNVDEDKAIELGKFIRKKREEKSWSQGQLSYKTGINNADIHRIESGQRKKINPFYLISLAEALEIDYIQLYQIAGYVDTKDIKSNVDKSYYEDKFEYVPLFESISAGYGSSNGEVIDYISIPGLKNPRECYAIKVKGDSMVPTIPESSIIIIRKDIELADGDMGAFMVDNDAYVKRYKPSKKYTVLISDNNKYPPMVINAGDEFHICGKVIRIIMEL